MIGLYRECNLARVPGPGWSLFHSVHMNLTVLPAATSAVLVTGTLFAPSIPMLQVIASVYTLRQPQATMTLKLYQ